MAALPSHTHSYLPLTGGTLSANTSRLLTVNNSNNTNNECGIGFNMSSVSKGWVGYDTTNGTYLYTYDGPHKLGIKADGTGFIDGNAIIHSGNIGQQSVASANALGSYTIDNFMTFGNHTNYVGARFQNSSLAQLAVDKYIEFWSTPGWFNSQWGKVTAHGGFTGDLTGNVTGNATTSTSAQWLSDSTLRRTSLNITPVGNGKMTKFLATSSATEGHPGQDGHIIHCEWDTTTGWNTQLFLADAGSAAANKRMMWRAMNNGTWDAWKVVAFTDGSINYATSSGSCAGTMTGIVTLIGDKYDMPNDTTLYTAMNCNNSNITGVNSITTADNAESGNEGIRFWRSATTNDCLYASNGVLYFTPNLSIGSSSTANNKVIIHSGNYTDYCASTGHTHTINKLTIKGIDAATTHGDYMGILQNASIDAMPSGTWFNVIKILHNNSAGYYTELAQSFTGTEGLYHRRMSNGVKSDWRLVLDSVNYTDYCAPKSHTHSYLPLSGGTMTGNISFQGTKQSYTMIRFVDNTTDVNGNGISIGGGGATIIGGGESASAAQGLLSSGGDERMIICNDADIEFFSNCQSGIASRKTMTFNASGQLIAGNFITNSDKRLKTNINEISSDKLSNSLNLNFVEFDYKDDDKHSAGHIAQEVKDILPEFVHGKETETEHLSIDYTGLHSIQIKALIDENNIMKKEIKELKELIKTLINEK